MMKTKNLINKFFLVALIGSILVAPSGDAFAWGWPRSLPPRHEVVEVRGHRYHYHEGGFYEPSFFGFTLVAPPLGAIITTLPFGYTRVIIGGATYYRHGYTYYSSCPAGYVVVPQPVVVPAVVSAAPAEVSYVEAAVINVPNTNGSYTAVRLIRRNNGYVGPQGEYYPDHPTVEQLRVLYGK